MKLKNLIIIIIVIGGLLAAKFIFFPSTKGDGKQFGQQGGKPTPTAVTAYIIKSEQLDNSIYASGSVFANEEVELKPEIAGKIIQLNINEGGAISKGQLLVKINDAEFQAQLKKILVQKNLAEIQLNREKELLKINGISQQDVEVSENKVKALQADVELLQSQLAKTEIKAPFNGIIGLKNVSEGAYVTNSTVIASIQQINPVKLDFYVSERYAEQLKKGSKIEFSVEGNQQKFIGEVAAIEPKIDLANRTLKIRAICPNNAGTIFPGSFANVKVDMGILENAMMIPTESVIPVLKGKTVFVVKNGIAEVVKIETGIRTDAMVQVTQGLSIGDTVIKTGIMQLKPGMPVKITNLKQ